MATAEPNMTDSALPRKSGARGLMTGVALALLMGGAGFYAVWSGAVLESREHAAPASDQVVPGMPDIAFVPIPPFLVSLGPGTKTRHLRFQAQLEVSRAQEADVTKLLPRVVDVLNSYLRAVEPSELEEPGALTRLRSQMLRRARIVTGEGRVRDLLIMEFVLN